MTPESSQTDEDATLWMQWREAVQRGDIDRAIADLYTRVDAAIAARGPTCWLSGRCCNFDEFGHRLYVTGLEIEWVLGKASRHGGTKARRGDEEQGGGKDESALSDPSCLRASVPSCLFQSNTLCTIHTIRPLGCRIFFCQDRTQDWQRELYEQFLNELRALHEEHDLPYRYMEWREGLRAALYSRSTICRR